jgi:hypothetical protein
MPFPADRGPPPVEELILLGIRGVRDLLQVDGWAPRPKRDRSLGHEAEGDDRLEGWVRDHVVELVSPLELVLIVEPVGLGKGAARIHGVGPGAEVDVGAGQPEL